MSPQQISRPSSGDDPGTKNENFLAAVGTRVHCVIAELSALECRQPAAIAVATWEAAERVLRTMPMVHRARSAKLMISGHAAVYLRHFLPPPTWRFLGAELPADDDGRIDLGWESELGVLYDELKLAATLAIPRADGETGRQVARYNLAGLTQHGSRFLGTRLLFLGAHRRSLFIDPQGHARPLLETPYWFMAAERPETAP